MVPILPIIYWYNHKSTYHTLVGIFYDQIGISKYSNFSVTNKQLLDLWNITTSWICLFHEYLIAHELYCTGQWTWHKIGMFLIQ